MKKFLEEVRNKNFSVFYPYFLVLLIIFASFAFRT
jgi:hypothetical protein